MSSSYRSQVSMKSSGKQPVSRDYDSKLDSAKRSMALHDIRVKEKINANEVKQRLDNLNEQAHVHEDQSPSSNDSQNHFVFYGFDFTLMVERLINMISFIPLMYYRARDLFDEIWYGRQNLWDVMEPYRTQLRYRMYELSSYFVDSVMLPFNFTKNLIPAVFENLCDQKALGSYRQSLSKKTDSRFTWESLKSETYIKNAFNVLSLVLGFFSFFTLSIVGVFRNYVMPFFQHEKVQSVLRYSRAIAVALIVFAYQVIVQFVSGLFQFLTNGAGEITSEEVQNQRNNAHSGSNANVNKKLIQNNVKSQFNNKGIKT